MLLTADDLDILMDTRHQLVPQEFLSWIHDNAKVMFFHKNNYFKGWLSSYEDKGWQFEMRRRKPTFETWATHS